MNCVLARIMTDRSRFQCSFPIKSLRNIYLRYDRYTEIIICAIFIESSKQMKFAGKTSKSIIYKMCFLTFSTEIVFQVSGLEFCFLLFWLLRFWKKKKKISTHYFYKFFLPQFFFYEWILKMETQAEITHDNRRVFNLTRCKVTPIIFR